MSSKALQIRDKIITLLTTPSPITGIGSGGVSVDPDYAFEAGDLPAVAVYLGDETIDRALIGADDRTLNVTVRVISKGSDAFANGDAVLVQVHSRIVTDLTLGGLALDVMQQGARRSRDVLEVPVAIAEIDYSVNYRTTTTSLEN